MEKRQILYVNDVQAAKMMGISPQTLRNWRCKGLGPEYVKLNGRCVRYELAALERYMSRYRITPYEDCDGSEQWEI